MEVRTHEPVEFSRPAGELSCIVGGLFESLDPPCGVSGSRADVLTIFGRTWGIRSKLAKEVEGIIGIKVPIHRKLNSTRAQRKARRERQQRFIEKKRRRAFDCETQRRTRNPDTPPWE